MNREAQIEAWRLGLVRILGVRKVFGILGLLRILRILAKWDKANPSEHA